MYILFGILAWLLFVVFEASALETFEQQIAIVIPQICIMGLAALIHLRHHSIYHRLLAAYLSTLVICFLLLAVFHENFYLTVVGPLLDLIFERDPHDPFVPGSGFIMLYDDNIWMLYWLLRLLRRLLVASIVMLGTPLVIVTGHILYQLEKETGYRSAVLMHIAEHGDVPDWYDANKMNNTISTPPVPFRSEVRQTPRKMFA